MIETEDTIKRILSAHGLALLLRSQGPAHPAPAPRGFAAPVAEAPKLCPARPPPSESGGEGEDWLN